MRHIDQQKLIDTVQLAEDVAKAFDLPADGKAYEVSAEVIKMPSGSVFVRHINVQRVEHDTVPIVVEGKRG